MLQPHGVHGARPFIYSCVIDPATGELKSDIHDLRDQYQHDFWIDVTFGLEKSGSNGYVVKYQGNVYHESTSSTYYLDETSGLFSGPTAEENYFSWDLYSDISLHSFGDSDFYVNAKMMRDSAGSQSLWR